MKLPISKKFWEQLETSIVEEWPIMLGGCAMIELHHLRWFIVIPACIIIAAAFGGYKHKRDQQAAEIERRLRALEEQQNTLEEAAWHFAWREVQKH